MAPTSIGLSKQAREQTAKHLNNLLADEFVLLMKTWSCHWNLKGPNFISLHELLDEQYHALVDFVDDIAERVRALDCIALRSLHDCHEHTRLKEMPSEVALPDQMGMIAGLLADHESVVRELRINHDSVEEYEHDVGTVSLMEDLIIKHEKMAWFLRAHLEK
ncbi:MULTISPECIES: DNA starvation/stationary phase protection protein [unclassified Pseudovibrio]|uniref:Dps family protein n=1 Tax=unclassified Pseudovibrio TaxID=2627060 RepID=UPI0007AE8D93|nr:MULTISPECIES: DNA starvation/stationary phase protection protein [unclassified Pseudovibrio]KZK99220.1 DNA protection during starvation protein [Pseudovibrio sp. Ad26]KZL22494.1 DNA protection during starvation protein [Pseudovibrio sp. WM33]